METALWTALRILEERRNLLKQIGDKELKSGKKALAATYHKRSSELETQSDKLKEILFAPSKTLS